MKQPKILVASAYILTETQFKDFKIDGIASNMRMKPDTAQNTSPKKLIVIYISILDLS